MQHPGSREQTESTDAEPGEEQRLPRSAPRLHLARRHHSPASTLTTCRGSFTRAWAAPPRAQTRQSTGCWNRLKDIVFPDDLFSSNGQGVKRLGPSAASQHPTQMEGVRVNPPSRNVNQLVHQNVKEFSYPHISRHNGIGLYANAREGEREEAVSWSDCTSRHQETPSDSQRCSAVNCG